MMYQSKTDKEERLCFLKIDTFNVNLTNQFIEAFFETYRSL